MSKKHHTQVYKGPNNNRQEVVIASRRMSGPLPPPEILGQYEQVLPGAAERIIKMAEKQSDHRQAIEKSVIRGDIFRGHAGVASGLIIAVLGIIIGAYTAMAGHPIFGGTIGIAPVASIIGTFIYGTNRKQNRIDQKKETDR